MKRIVSMIAGVLFAAFLIGCSGEKEVVQAADSYSEAEPAKIETIAQKDSDAMRQILKKTIEGNSIIFELNNATAADDLYQQLPIMSEAENTATDTVWIQIGEKKFSLKFYENEASRTFRNSLPLTITMSEMNGNEKYYYLPENLSADASNPLEIKAGDLMLYGSNCLVLFYENFTTSYSYTPLGYVEDITGLADALGRGDATVTFSGGIG